jgi:phosphoglycerol transferase MdoB-like AlkP superfamily enzyme
MVARAARYRWAAALWLIFVTASTLTRVAILLWARPGATRPALLAEAFAAGAAYDALVAFWLVAPFMVYLTVARSTRFERRRQRAWRRMAVGATTAVAFFMAAAELVFFDEFNGRFNFVAVDYLVYPTEVTTNIWESYHVSWALAAITVAVALTMRMLRPALRDLDRNPGPALRSRLAIAAGYGVVLLVLTSMVSPTLARVSDDRVINELAANGYYTFWRSLLGKDAPYDGLYATRPDSVLYPALQRLLAETASTPEARATEDIRRNIRSSIAPRRLNVVVVLEESFGSSFVGALHHGDSASITPAFDSLAARGTLLTRAYSTGNRTIRALEATTSSLPPLPGVSIVRRPQSVDLFTLPSVLRAQGYATEFIYGGRAMFDGMGAYMRNNGIDRVVEQRDFPDSTFTTAWGVADEAIFDKALTEMDSLHATGRPFYSLVLTVSNHRPYTYPSGRISQDPAEKRRTYAVRYADWALGRFMRDARSHPFFDSTLFVVMGDHGARVYGSAEIPLPSYEVPVLFYSPRTIPAGVRLNTIASSLDIPPTILGVLGLSYESKFFGRDVFHEDTADGRALMAHNAELALMRGRRMAVLGLRGATTVYAVESTGGLSTVESPSASDRELVEEAITYYATADHTYRNGGYLFVPSAAGVGDEPSRTNRVAASNTAATRCGPPGRNGRGRPRKPDTGSSRPLTGDDTVRKHHRGSHDASAVLTRAASTCPSGHA